MNDVLIEFDGKDNNYVIKIEETPQTVIDRKEKPYKIFNQLLYTTIVSWLSIIVGYVSAYSSPAESSMIIDLNLTINEASWISSLVPAGAIVGSLVGGFFVEILGRKNTLIVTDFIFLLAWLINYLAQNSWAMYISRVLNGYCVGITSFAVPVYLTEILHPEIRGRLGLFPTVFGNFGILICYIFGNLCKWRDLAGIGATLSVPFLLFIWMVPESPRWYRSKGRDKKAEASEQKLIGKLYHSNEESKKLDPVRNNNNNNINNNSNNNNNKGKLPIKPFAIVLGLMFFQQFSGINALIFYTTQIFNHSGSSLDSSISSAIVGVVNFISSFIAAIIIDRLGRKPLLYISSSLVACMLAILGLYFYLNLSYKLVSVRYLPLLCFIVYVLAFSLGLGPIPWLMMGEILPEARRGLAASISAAFNWSCTSIIIKTFPFFALIGTHYVFWFLSIIMICSLLFIKVYVPETKNRTLESIEKELARR